MVADSYDPVTGKITRRVGVEIMDGTESIQVYSSGFMFYAIGRDVDKNGPISCSHSIDGITSFVDGSLYWRTACDNIGVAREDLTALKAWIASQYDAGTPVTFYYRLLTPVEENPVQ